MSRNSLPSWEERKTAINSVLAKHNIPALSLNPPGYYGDDLPLMFALLKEVPENIVSALRGIFDLPYTSDYRGDDEISPEIREEGQSRGVDVFKMGVLRGHLKNPESSKPIGPYYDYLPYFRSRQRTLSWSIMNTEELHLESRLYFPDKVFFARANAISLYCNNTKKDFLDHELNLRHLSELTFQGVEIEKVKRGFRRFRQQPDEGENLDHWVIRPLTGQEVNYLWFHADPLFRRHYYGEAHV